MRWYSLIIYIPPFHNGSSLTRWSCAILRRRRWTKTVWIHLQECDLPEAKEECWNRVPQFVWYWPMRDPQNISRATTISSLEGPGRCRFAVFQFCAWIKILISGYRLVTFQSFWNWRRRQFLDNLPFGPVRDDRHPGKGSKQCTVSLLCFGCRFGFGPSDLNRFKNFRRHSQSNDHVYGECAGVQRFKIWTSWSKVTFDPLCATYCRAVVGSRMVADFIFQSLRVLIWSLSNYNHRIIPDCRESRIQDLVRDICRPVFIGNLLVNFLFMRIWLWDF